MKKRKTMTTVDKLAAIRILTADATCLENELRDAGIIRDGESDARKNIERARSLDSKHSDGDFVKKLADYSETANNIAAVKEELVYIGVLKPGENVLCDAVAERAAIYTYRNISEEIAAGHCVDQEDLDKLCKAGGTTDPKRIRNALRIINSAEKAHPERWDREKRTLKSGNISDAISTDEDSGSKTGEENPDGETGEEYDDVPPPPYRDESAEIEVPGYTAAEIEEMNAAHTAEEAANEASWAAYAETWDVK